MEGATLKAFEINDLKNGLKSELALYQRILDISRRERSALLSGENADSVFQFIPEKMKLLEQIATLDATITLLKQEWERLKIQGDSMPSEVLDLLKEAEKIILETILIDEQNQEDIANFRRKMQLERVPKNVLSQVQVRAKNAYGGGK